ncbi:hypothetical protein HED60_01905 [Planctomycetales bacterium ZRK34]|nr:hypothetical protein HED60_01905 [Planctomycetales bacterium ZRK34]
MNDQASHPDALRPLLIALSDGTLVADQWDRLNDLLDSNVEAQDRYLDHLIHEALLHREFSQRVEDRVQTDQPTPTLRRSRSVWYPLAAAAMIALAVTAWFVFWSPASESEVGPSQSQALALLSDVEYARWGKSTLPTALGSDLPAGRLQLEAGAAQVMFRSGAVVDMTGPCEFEVLDSGRAFLHKGLIHVLVPEQARGFTVEAPAGARVIDLGTEFIMHVDAGGQTWAQVTRGVVRMTMADQSHRLVAGQSAVAMATGTLRLAAPGEHRFAVTPAFDVIELGNLFDDAAGDTLADAIYTDTPKRAPTDQSLGVWHVQTGQLDRPQAVGPNIMIDLSTIGGGEPQAGPPANDAARAMGNYELRLGADDTRTRQGIGMHANALISFDLHTIRAAGGLSTNLPMHFRATGRVNPSAIHGGGGSVVLVAIVCNDRGPIAGYVNGQLRPMQQAADGVWSFDGPTPQLLSVMSEPVDFDAAIGPDGAYLVIACLGGENGISADHGVFIDARLVLNDKDHTPSTGE